MREGRLSFSGLKLSNRSGNLFNSFNSFVLTLINSRFNFERKFVAEPPKEDENASDSPKSVISPDVELRAKFAENKLFFLRTITEESGKDSLSLFIFKNVKRILRDLFRLLEKFCSMSMIKIAQLSQIS